MYRAIDDETRRRLLDLLVERDGRTLFELCGALAMRFDVSLTRQAISQHLTVLEDAGLVSTERRGRTKHHFIHTEPLAEITRRWPAAERN